LKCILLDKPIGRELRRQRRPRTSGTFSGLFAVVGVIRGYKALSLMEHETNDNLRAMTATFDLDAALQRLTISTEERG